MIYLKFGITPMKFGPKIKPTNITMNCLKTAKNYQKMKFYVKITLKLRKKFLVFYLANISYFTEL